MPWNRIFTCGAAVLLFSGTFARASPALDAAVALARDKHYPEARAALEKIVAAEPTNAAACHELGMVLRARADNAAFEQAVKWLGRATELEPANPRYLGDFGGASLELASRTRSYSAATRGRDAMEKAVALDPDYVDAREGLYQFYQQAPWPIGSTSKAAAQLAEITKRDPDRGTVLSVLTKVAAGDFASAFRLCDSVLARKPDNYIALYHYGRTAAISGQNLERGLACLKKCGTLDPPTPASPTHSHVWNRRGNIEEKLGHPAEARAAYQAALKEDPSNRQAADALAKLK